MSIRHCMTSLTAMALMLSACTGEATQAPDGSAGETLPGNATAPAASTRSAEPAQATAQNGNTAAEAAVRAVYAPYLSSNQNVPSVTEQGVYTAELQTLIARWRQATRDLNEPTDLSSADWLCSCQDWDPAKARLAIDAVNRNADGRVTVTASFNPGFDGGGQMSDLIMKQENGRWLIDDIGFSGESPTLRELLAQETRNGG
jgi:hypothetical protein